jgi:bacillithiol biosynthesis deacetylase BshB1
VSYDMLAVGAHPDDLELGVGGIIAALTAAGKRVLMLDLTRASLSTRGDPETRSREAAAAARILGADRENLDMIEGTILTNPDNLYQLVSLIRRTRPRLILTPYFEDRHPDHANTSKLVQEAYFWAGVAKWGDAAPVHRPNRVAYYFCHYEGPASMVVDVSATFERKMESVKAYRSQFTVGEGERPNTFISRPEFMDRVIARAKYYGYQIGAEYGEPLFVRETHRVTDLLAWNDMQGHTG